MDDFRVGSTSPLDAYADRELPDKRKRKNKRQTSGIADEDQVMLSGGAVSADECMEDLYSPSETSGETELDT